MAGCRDNVPSLRITAIQHQTQIYFFTYPFFWTRHSMPAKRKAKKGEEEVGVKGSEDKPAKDDTTEEQPAKKAKDQKQDKEKDKAGGVDVHILGSKACQAFAKHADKLVAAVKKAAPGTTFTIEHAPKEGKNPDRGSFVVKANGKEIVACRSMPRPFKAMKDLDIEGDIAGKVVAELK